MQAGPVTAAQYQNTPGVVVVAKQALRTNWLEINMTLKPFDNVKVREAMRAAIDYPGLVSAVLRGFGTPGYAGLLMPGMTGYDPAINPRNTFDLSKARALLREAGVPLPINGFFTTYNDTLDVNAAQFIAANLAQIGINLQPRPLERGTLVQERIKPTTPASIIGTSLSPDPDFLLSLTFISKQNPPAGLNIARYGGIDKLYDEQHFVSTAAERNKVLQEIQKRFVQDVPAIEYYVKQDIWLVNARVRNYQPNVLFSGDPLAQVTLAAK